jgi:hypothetical protein
MKRVLGIVYKFSIGILSLIGFITIIVRFSPSPNYVTTLKFVNESGEIVTKAKIDHQGDLCAASGLQPNGLIECYFGEPYESSYSVSIDLENGETISNNNLGYIAAGMDNHHIIRLTKSNELSFGFVQ